jgi:hypothetical protein
LKRLAASVTLLGFALCVPACAPREEPLIARFFEASRLRDRTALQQFSSVMFDPAEQGIVRTFTITQVSPERIGADVVTKEVTVRAPVVTAAGPVVDETLVVTLRRADERQSGYGWMVAGVRDVRAEAGPRSVPLW